MSKITAEQLNAARVLIEEMPDAEFESLAGEPSESERRSSMLNFPTSPEWYQMVAMIEREADNACEAGQYAELERFLLATTLP